MSFLPVHGKKTSGANTSPQSKACGSDQSRLRVTLCRRAHRWRRSAQRLKAVVRIRRRAYISLRAREIAADLAVAARDGAAGGFPPGGPERFLRLAAYLSCRRGATHATAPRTPGTHQAASKNRAGQIHHGGGGGGSPTSISTTVRPCCRSIASRMPGGGSTGK